MSQPIRIEERADDAVVARDESTGIEAKGNNVPTALQTLSEKLEIDLYRNGE